MIKITSAEPLWWYSALFFLVTFVLIGLVSLVDHRLYDTVTLWAKPMKFALSLSLHFATLAAIVHCFSLPWQNSRILAVLAILSILCALGEVAYIALQAARQQASHFNVDTPLYAFLYNLMAAGAVVLVVASAFVGVVAAVDGHGIIPMPMRIAITIGLVGGSLLTLITAFRLGANMSHHIGNEPAGALRMPLTGWSLEVGDLRPPHFLATHMMQTVPVFGLVASRLMSATSATVTVVLFSLAWTVLTVVTFYLALSGRPFTAIWGR